MKKKNKNKDRKSRFIGMALIFGALILVGLLITTVFPRDEAEDKGNKTQAEKILDDARRQSLIDEAERTGTDTEDIDPEKAKEIMRLKVVIPDQLVEAYLDGDREGLEKKMEDFLVKYDFYMDVTKAVCTQTVTKDYKRNITNMEFTLNDQAKTTLTLEYHGDTNKFDFNFY